MNLYEVTLCVDEEWLDRLYNIVQSNQGNHNGSIIDYVNVEQVAFEREEN